MNINLHILEASGKLAGYSEAIQGNFDAAVKKITQKIPARDIDVVVYDDAKDVIPELGIVGYTPNGYVIFITLGPDHPKFDETVNEHFAHTLAHEIHHIMRWRNHGYGKTLGEAMITEGLADHFDMEVTGGDIPLWSRVLSPEKLTAITNRAKQEWHNGQYNHHAWFFGSPEENIPRWAGYSIGFELVRKYLEANPNQKPSKLYDIDAEKFT